MDAPHSGCNLTDLIGAIPYRMAFAGGWIDQPFISRLNPAPPGSMVVVQIEPNFRPMDRSGIASGTRAVAARRRSHAASRSATAAARSVPGA